MGIATLNPSYAGWQNVDQATTPRMRIVVVTLVTALHIAAFTTLVLQPPRVSVTMRESESESEMTVTLDVTGENTPPTLRVKTLTIPEAEAQIETPKPASLSEQPVVATPPAHPSDESSQTQREENAATEIEPEYQAAYLNNRLTYPLAARRMGVQGRVVLNVEVLAEGMVGKINIRQSSGHEVLDQAALESVKHWRFIAARRGGEPYTRWFTVPIKFSLQDQTK